MDAATSPAVATAGEAAANSASSSSNAEAAAKVPASNAEDDESEARGSGEARGADTTGSSSSSSAADTAADASPAVATVGEAAATSASSSSNAEAAAKVPASNAEDDESEARGSGEARGADTMGSSSSSSAAAPAATVVSMSLPDALGALFSLDNQRDFAHGLQVDGVDGGIAALVDSSARRSRVAVSQLVLVDDRSVPGFQMRAIDTNGAVKAPTRDGKIASTRVVLAKGDFLEDTLLNVFSIFDVAMETSGSKAWYTAGELYAFKRGGKEVPCLLLGVVDAGEKTKAGGSDNITLPRLLPVVVPVEMFQSAPFGVLLPGLKYLHNTSVERGVLDSKMVKNVLAAFRVEPNRGIANMFFPEKDVAVSGRARKRGAAINYNESSTPKASSVSSGALRAPRKKVFSDAQLRSPTTQFNVADLNNMSVSVLKMILSSRSQADGGRKNDLVTRVLSGVKKEESSKRRKTAKKMPKKTPKKKTKKKKEFIDVHKILDDIAKTPVQLDFLLHIFDRVADAPNHGLPRRLRNATNMGKAQRLREDQCKRRGPGWVEAYSNADARVQKLVKYMAKCGDVVGNNVEEFSLLQEKMLKSLVDAIVSEIQGKEHTPPVSAKKYVQYLKEQLKERDEAPLSESFKDSPMPTLGYEQNTNPEQENGANGETIAEGKKRRKNRRKKAGQKAKRARKAATKKAEPEQQESTVQGARRTVATNSEASTQTDTRTPLIEEARGGFRCAICNCDVSRNQEEDHVAGMLE